MKTKICIIYTRDKEVGKQQLECIKSEKGCDGIYPTLYNNAYNAPSIVFSDGEIWKIAQPSENHRGIRWDKAYIDGKSVSMKDYVVNILPCGKEKLQEHITVFNLQ